MEVAGISPRGTVSAALLHSLPSSPHPPACLCTHKSTHTKRLWMASPYVSDLLQAERSLQMRKPSLPMLTPASHSVIRLLLSDRTLMAKDTSTAGPPLQATGSRAAVMYGLPKALGL
jgi:hypothetical protein